MTPSLFLLAAVLQAATPPVGVPGEVLRCGTDRSTETLLCRAVVAQREQRHADSAAAFEDAASLAAASDAGLAARALAGAGNMWILAGRPEAAAAAIDKALAMNSFDSVQRGLALLDRARAAVMLLEPQVAEGFAAEAQALIPQDPFAWYFTAGLALYANDHDRAKEHIDRALALAPDSPDLLLRAAAIAEARGDDDAMRAYLRSAVTYGEDSPSGASAAALLEQLEKSANAAAGVPDGEAAE